MSVFSLVTVFMAALAGPALAARTDQVQLGAPDGTLPLMLPTTEVVEDGATPTKYPLVLFLHGFCLDPVRQETSMAGFEQLIDSEQFALALPTGPSNGGGVMLPICSAWDGTDGSRLLLPLYMRRPLGDVPFLKNVLKRAIDHMSQSNKSVDPTRIYAIGLANGGFMAHRLACELPQVFAAAVAYTGATGAEDNDSTCVDNWAELGGTNVLQIHGDADVWVPYEGGVNWPGSADSTRFVAEGMGCDTESPTTNPDAFAIPAGGTTHTVSVTEYTGCEDGGSSTEWRVNGMDHLPGGGSGLKPLLKRALRWMLEQRQPDATDETLAAALADAAPGNGGSANAPSASAFTTGLGAGSSAGSLARYAARTPQLLAGFAGAAVGEAGTSSRPAAALAG